MHSTVTFRISSPVLAAILLACPACHREQHTTPQLEAVAPGDQTQSRPAVASASPSPESAKTDSPGDISTAGVSEFPAGTSGDSTGPLPAADLSALEAVSQEQVAEHVAAVEAQPQDAEAAGTLAMLYHAYGLYREACVVYRRAAALDPDSFRWEYLWAQALLAVNEPGEAVPHLRRARQLRPDYAPAEIWLAQSLMHSGDAVEAAHVALARHEAAPEDDLATYTLGIACLAAKEPVWGLEYLKPLLDAYPHYGSVRAAVAECFRALGQADRAEETLAGGPANGLAPTLRDPELVAIYRLPVGAEAERRKALANMAAGRFDQALAHYDAALGFSPEDAAALAGRGEALLQLGRISEAETTLKRALEGDPTSLANLVRLAQIYLLTERVEAAAPLIERALRADAASREAWGLKAHLALLQGDRTQAAQALEQLVALDGGSADVYAQLGSVYWAMGRLDDAVAALQRAIELAPQDAEAQEMLAHVYYQRGATDAAHTWYDRAYALGARSAQTFEQVALHAMQRGNYARVQEALHRGLEFYPGNPDLSDAVVRLYALCPDASFRNGVEALRLAQLIYGADETQTSLRGLNSLAAAHAEVGNFEEAARLTELALERLTDEDDSARPKLMMNLAKYQRGKHAYDRY